MYCWKCGTETTPDDVFCKTCGSSLHPAVPSKPSIKPHLQPASPYAPPVVKRSPLPIILGIIVIIGIIVAGIFTVPPLVEEYFGKENNEKASSKDNSDKTKPSGKSGGFADNGTLEIELGKPKEAGSGIVGSSGGNVVIDDAKSNLSGLSIKIPEGAYTGDVEFTISEVPLEIDFGEEFVPLTPLIRVENGGIAADGFMEIFVPCEVPDEAEPVAWYVDESTGEIEGIPVIDVSDEGVTLSVRHFSSIFVGAEKSIKDLGVIDTGFTPGVDDWKFTNRGSAYAPGGHCAGQSMTAMWYYIMRKSGGSLFNKFDNYGWKDYGFETPTIWQDDVMGYRLATTAQYNLDWTDAKYNDFLDSCKRSPRGTYYAFVNTMNRTKRPQFVGILRKKPDGKYGGHALIAYKVDTAAGRIYIADPNYPGATDRYIEYDEATGFKPYSSAPDRDAADAGDYYSYTEILFIGISSFMDLDNLKGCFKDFDSRTIGNGIWQSRDLKIFTKISDADGNEQEIEITEGYIAPAQLKITRYQTPFNNSKIELFLHNSKGDKSLGDFGTEMLIDLEPGENYIGVYHKILTNNGKLKFYDFVWIKVDRSFDFAGEWQGEMTWSKIDLPSLADVIATIPHGENEEAYQSEVQIVTDDYNRVTYDIGKTYSATLTISLENGIYEAEIIENHDIDGELSSYFAYSLKDDMLVMDETDGVDSVYFTFEKDKAAPPGTDRIIGKLTAHLTDDNFEADAVVDFKFERVPETQP